MRKKIKIIVVLLALIIVWKVLSPLMVIAIRNTDISEVQWKKDILFLKKELVSRHINAYAKLDKEEYDRVFDKLTDEVSTLQSDEILIRLMENVALIGDAHTKLFNYQIESDAIYPFELYRFQDGYYVAKASVANQSIIGSKLTAINEVRMEAVEEQVSKLISHENKYWLYRNMPSLIRDPRVLKYFKIIKDEAAEFSFADAEGKSYKIVLRPDKANNIQLIQKVKSTSEASASPEEYQFFEKEKTFYINVYKNEQLSIDLNEMLNRSEYKNAENLIIDLRNHSGGSFAPNSKLVNSIKNHEINKEGQLFVIIGRNTYSSGLLLAVDLKKNTQAVFYGEPTGGKPEHFGDIRNIKLPNSKVVVTYSTKHFADQDNKRDALYPAVEVNSTITDVLNDRDVVLEAIFEKVE